MSVFFLRRCMGGIGMDQYGGRLEKLKRRGAHTSWMWSLYRSQMGFLDQMGGWYFPSGNGFSQLKCWPTESDMNFSRETFDCQGEFDIVKFEYVIFVNSQWVSSKQHYIKWQCSEARFLGTSLVPFWLRVSISLVNRDFGWLRICSVCQCIFCDRVDFFWWVL